MVSIAGILANSLIAIIAFTIIKVLLLPERSTESRWPRTRCFSNSFDNEYLAGCFPPSAFPPLQQDSETFSCECATYLETLEIQLHNPDGDDLHGSDGAIISPFSILFLLFLLKSYNGYESSAQPTRTFTSATTLLSGSPQNEYEAFYCT
jgi:hypothetical protein